MRKDKFKKKTNEERKVELTTALQKLEDGVVDLFTSDDRIGIRALSVNQMVYMISRTYGF